MPGPEAWSSLHELGLDPAPGQRGAGLSLLSDFLKILVSTWRDSNYAGDNVNCYVRREGGQAAE